MTALTAANREIRHALKDALPECKFSVVGERASMMTETTISLMAAPWAAVEADSPRYWDGGPSTFVHILTNPLTFVKYCDTMRVD